MTARIAERHDPIAMDLFEAQLFTHHPIARSREKPAVSPRTVRLPTIQYALDCENVVRIQVERESRLRAANSIGVRAGDLVHEGAETRIGAETIIVD